MNPFFEGDTGRLTAPLRLLLQYLTYRILVPLFVNLLAVTWLVAGRGAGSSGGLDTFALAGSRSSGAAPPS